MYTYKKFTSKRINEVKEIYRREEWNAYLKDDDKLIRAFDNSLSILGAFTEDDRLIGFIRCVGDGEHIVVVQDLIVDKEYQKQGIGTQLFKSALQEFSNVRMFQVVTDIEDDIDNHFYQSFGMKTLEEGNMISYFR